MRGGLVTLRPETNAFPMKSKIAFLLLCLTITGVALADKKLWAKSVLGKKAPDFVVEKWLTPEPARDGKFVLIDFWATWCPPCRQTIPELNGYQKKFADKLVVIGVSDEPEEKVRGLKDPKVEYSSAIDTKARMKKELAVTGIPHVILIDPKGIVRWEGFPLLNGEELTEKAIEDVMAKYSK